MRNRRSAPVVTNPGRTRSFVATVALLAAGLIAVSCWVDPWGYESFRIPEELVFRAEAILLLLVGAFAATAPRFDWREAVRRIPRNEWIVSAAILGWTLVTTLTSTNRLLSSSSIVTVVAAVVIYLASRFVAPHLPLAALGFCCLPAIVNGVICILQVTKTWDPFKYEGSQFHYSSSGLLGNPNYIGTYLSGPAIASLVAALVLSGRRRWLYAGIAFILAAGILASSTRTAVIAYAAGLLAFALIRPWRQALVVGGVLAAGIFVALMPETPIGARFQRLVTAAKEHRYEELSSERLVPALTAIELIRRHPLTGVGPGCFGFHYVEEREALRGKYPASLLQSYPQNFGEVHDDHLQVMAETGLPGYAIFLAAITMFALPELRRRGVGEDVSTRNRFARTLRIPLATTFFVICLAQFPLEVAASRSIFLALAAIVNGWDQP